MEPKLIVVAIPAFNEAGTIRDILSEIPSKIRSFPVLKIVVDDGSRDGTGDIAESCGALVIRHMINLGLGAATQTGLRAAQRLNADIVVTMDADGQHNPAEIERLVRCLIDESLDVVIGSGLLNPDQRRWSRIGANLLLNAATLIMYRKVVSDSHSGFKALSRTAVYRLKLRSAGFSISAEIIGEIYRRNLRYKSLPVQVEPANYSVAKEPHFLTTINLIFGLFVRWVRRV